MMGNAQGHARRGFHGGLDAWTPSLLTTNQKAPRAARGKQIKDAPSVVLHGEL